MLDLFLSVSLNPPQKSLHLVLLFLSQSRFLLSYLDVELFLHVVYLLFLERLANKFDFLCIDIVLDREVNTLLFT